MDKAKVVEDKVISNDMVCLSRQYHYKFFKDYLSRILSGSFMNTLYNNPLTQNLFNPFLANVPILYHLKTPKNLWFSSVFRRYKMGTFVRNRLKLIIKE